LFYYVTLVQPVMAVCWLAGAVLYFVGNLWFALFQGSRPAHSRRGGEQSLEKRRHLSWRWVYR